MSPRRSSRSATVLVAVAMAGSPWNRSGRPLLAFEQRVIRGDLVEVTEGGEVEAGAVEQLGGGVGQHGDDADVDDLRGLLAHDVDAQELHVVAAEDQLEEAGLIADDLA